TPRGRGRLPPRGGTNSTRAQPPAPRIPPRRHGKGYRIRAACHRDSRAPGPHVPDRHGCLVPRSGRVKTEARSAPPHLARLCACQGPIDVPEGGASTQPRYRLPILVDKNRGDLLDGELPDELGAAVGVDPQDLDPRALAHLEPRQNGLHSPPDP